MEVKALNRCAMSPVIEALVTMMGSETQRYMQTALTFPAASPGGRVRDRISSSSTLASRRPDLQALIA